MTLEDMLRAQRNHAMDAAAQIGLAFEQLKAEHAALKNAQPKVQMVPHVEMVPRQAAKVADPGQD